MRPKRRLALAVLLAAAATAIVAFPFRATWWGGFILAIAEAGIVGGLADWFAVTAIFRRPLGLPIPHTGIISANWELLARRVGDDRRVPALRGLTGFAVRPQPMGSDRRGHRWIRPAEAQPDELVEQGRGP